MLESKQNNLIDYKDIRDSNDGMVSNCITSNNQIIKCSSL